MEGTRGVVREALFKRERSRLISAMISPNQLRAKAYAFNANLNDGMVQVYLVRKLLVGHIMLLGSATRKVKSTDRTNPATANKFYVRRHHVITRFLV